MDIHPQHAPDLMKLMKKIGPSLQTVKILKSEIERKCTTLKAEDKNKQTNK